MNTTCIRFATSAALLAGLLGGMATPAVADHKPNQAVAASSEPLMAKKCVKAFRTERRRLNNQVWVHAYDYYEARRKAEQVIYDQMRWIMSDPNAQELIPGQEAAAAQVLAEVQPIVAQQRDDYYKQLDTFQAKYLRNGCLSKNGKKVFKAGMRSFRASFQDIYKAHEQLFRANFAVQTAQLDTAGQCLQDADLEAQTIGENFQLAHKQFQILTP